MLRVSRFHILTMDALIQLDYQIFNAINQGLSHPWLDVIMPLMRNKFIWFPLYIFILSWFWSEYGSRKGTIMVLGLMTCVALSDLCSSHLIKKSIKRPRPCREIAIQDTIINRASCRGSYSFTSSHATNHFAMATIFILMIGGSGRRKYLWWVWAGLISFAQVYVGLHYALDVLAGSILGIGVARLYYQVIYRRLLQLV